MLERLNNEDYFNCVDSQERGTKRNGNVGISSTAPASSTAELLPSPIRRPGHKEELEKKSLDGSRLPHNAISDVWSYIPDCVLNQWRSSNGIPGVRKYAPSDKLYAANMKQHFLVVGTAPTSPVLQWQGPNLMSAETGTKEVFQYIKEDLGIYWTQWVELRVTGYTPPFNQSPPQPVWTWSEVFHVHASSQLTERNGLGALRDEANHRYRIFNMAYLQVVMIIRPPG
ncbi:hypothetical protein N7523_005614 [Penicillium sp. IBT 18751x]|nr:hypothetical protein N7523_005793 [Penicillium sp. IBT 18751x]KAJ6117863.1 hypothetical protein N7523_005614 [Penicillium sp. IBT 18751x]